MEGEPFTIPVFCRPNLSFYKKEGTPDELYQNCLQIVENAITLTDSDQVRKFTDIFSVCAPATSQSEFYEKISTAVGIADVVNGYNSTVVAYGQTGGGKTYTMVGDITNEEKKGAIPRAMETVFAAIDEAQATNANLSFVVTISYLSIYNERVIDLLCKLDSHGNPGRDLQLKQHVTEGVYVKDLSQCIIRSAEEGIAVLQQGIQNRLIGTTRMGQCSSRMHTLFYINVFRQDRSTNMVKTGTIICADLAGSERVMKSGATGVTLHEANKIGLSLCALGNVIAAVSENATNPDKQSHVPYRDSKITRLLQDSLGGTTRTAFVACVSACAMNSAETLSTFRYALRASKIVNCVRTHESAADVGEFGARVAAVFARAEQQHVETGGLLNTEAESPNVSGSKGETGTLPGDFQATATADIL